MSYFPRPYANMEPEMPRCRKGVSRLVSVLVEERVDPKSQEPCVDRCVPSHGPGPYLAA